MGTPFLIAECENKIFACLTNLLRVRIIISPCRGPLLVSRIIRYCLRICRFARYFLFS